MLSDFLSAGDNAKYAPQSLTVQGILRDMYETFSSDLESSTSTEAERNRAFEDLIAIKTEELAQLEKTVDEKESQKADAEALLSDTTQSYDDTEAQKDADIVFFDETKGSCERKSAEWTTRSDLRAEELKGIKAALAILSTDDARVLFKSSIKEGKETGMVESFDTGVSIDSFLQVRSTTVSGPAGATGTSANSAYNVLKAKA